MNGEGGATTARWGWRRVVLVVLVIVFAFAMLAGYAVWGLLLPWYRSPAVFPAAENPVGPLARLKSQVGYAPPTDARLVWNRSESGWGGVSSEDWVFFVPSGKASRDAIIAGIGRTGALSMNDARASEEIAARLGIRSIGKPAWSYTAEPWEPVKNVSASISAVETDQGVCIYVKVGTGGPSR